MALGLLVLAAAIGALAVGPLAAPPSELLMALFSDGTARAELALSLRGPRLLASAAAMTGTPISAKTPWRAKREKKSPPRAPASMDDDDSTMTRPMPVNSAVIASSTW